jgi:hypothetical protein
VQCLGLVFNKFHELVKNKEKPVSYISCKNALGEWIEFAISVRSDRMDIVSKIS